MSLIERYIVREVRRPLFALLGVLAFIFASYTASRYLNEAASGAIGLGTVLQLTGYKVLIALEVLAPVGLYVSVVLGLGRLHHDQEMTVMATAGISPRRTYRAVGLLALPVALLVGLLSIYGRPWAYAEAYALEAQQTSDLDLSRLQAERFNVNNDTGRMILATRVDATNGRLYDVLIYSDGTKRNHVIRAREAWLADPDPAHPVLALRDGATYSLQQGGPHDRTLHFREMTLHLEPVRAAADYRRKAASTAELAASSGLPERAELQWRLSRGPTALLLALLAVPLSRTPPRGGRFTNLLPVTAVFALIYYAGGMFKNLIEKGNMPMWPGLWLIPLLMAVALFLLMRRSAKP